jgi:sterol desaturase/sphingolipid hydroxylase (fatty acid hydroxylase superfamily)
MDWSKIDRSKEPLRLFESDFLEFFTHVHPAAVLVAWVPIIGYFLARGIAGRPPGARPLFIPVAILAGLFVWTLVEYSGHRFVFHFPPRTPRQERLLFLVHGVHHAQPQVKTRLVLPPVLTLPLGVLFYAAFYLIMGIALGAPHWVAPLFAGFGSGYVAYDMLHYATHHLAMRRGFLRSLKRYHVQHHYTTPNQRFGVTSPLWDIVFGTRPA